MPYSVCPLKRLAGMGSRPGRRQLLPVGGAAAFTLARVLAFTAVIARLASTLALAGIEALTSVLLDWVVRRLARDRANSGTGGRGRVDPRHSATQQTGEGRCEHQRTLRNFHDVAPLASTSLAE